MKFFDQYQYPEPVSPKLVDPEQDQSRQNGETRSGAAKMGRPEAEQPKGFVTRQQCWHFSTSALLRSFL